MRLAPFQDRLKQAAPALLDVLVAADGPIGVEDLHRTPAAVVAPFRTLAQPNPYGTQIVSQALTEQVSVTVVLRNLADRRGGAAAVGLAEIVREMRAALIGWGHPDAEAPTELVSGRIVPFSAATRALGWLDIYRYDHSHRTEVIP